MKGKLHKSEYNVWLVKYEEEDLQLHPDDVNQILKLSEIFDSIESRIYSDPIVEFEIIENKKMDGVVKYAKLVDRTYEIINN